MKRELLSLDRGWRFHLGEVKDEKYMGHDALYTAAKAASSKGPGRRDFDDSAWRVVDLPHDYVVEGSPTPEEPYSQGSLPRKNAWYRRTFLLSEEDRGKRIALHFEGVCTACVVHVNGQPMFRNYTAGVGFDVDITEIARYGEDANVVAVYVDCSDFEGWYYEGGGIYRHVWLVKTGKVFVDLWGTFVRSEKLDDGAFRTKISTEIKNITDEDKRVTVCSEIVDPGGNMAAVVSSDQMIPARSEAVFEQSADVYNVRLWDLDSPELYTLKTTVLADNEVTDTYETPFGYRTIAYTSSDGFLLNGRRVFLNGYGSHQDSTGFGIGMPDSLSEFRMARLKSAGFNLFRTVHNPFAPALYDACDRMGLMCMDENRWFSPSLQTQDEVARMIKRDRNHPSIIMWSLFNEEFYRDSYIGTNIFKTLAAIVHKLDPTRPATGADNVATAIPGMMDDIDLIGINHVYNHDALDAVRTNNPDKPIFFSEEGLSDDIRAYCRTRPYIFGAIGFGGLPYRGETSYPYLFSGSDEHSTFNLLCDPMDNFWRERALWTEADSLKIAGHWTYPGREGEAIRVRVYTNRETVELFLNGNSLGKQAVDPAHALAEFEVPYEPGELRAVGSSAGFEDLTDTIRTAGPAEKLVLKLENPGVRANGRDTAIVSAQFADADGNLLPDTDDLLVRFRVMRGGKFLAVGSPNRGDHASWKIPEIRMHKNKAEVYAEASADGEPLEIEAVADGFAPAVLVIDKLAADPIPEVPAEYCRFLDKWLLSRTLIDQPWPDIDAMHRHPNFNTGAGWELDDVWMLSNGNILFSRMYWAAMVTPDKKQVWRMEAPEHTEIHTLQPLDLNRAALVINKDREPHLLIVNTATGEVESDRIMPYIGESGTHGQNRRFRVTAQGTYLMPYLSGGKVVEFDKDFNEIWSVDVGKPWAAIRLKNGNTLVSDESDESVIEFRPDKSVAWKLTQEDLGEYRLAGTQSCVRLDNGNTILCARGDNGRTAQLVEVTPEKEVVWVMKDWQHFGPGTAVQILKDGGVPENPGECQR